MSASDDITRIESGDLLIEKDANGKLVIHNLADGESIEIGGAAGVSTGGNEMFHTGNDGTGSGLNADMVDGQHAADLGGTGTAGPAGRRELVTTITDSDPTTGLSVDEAIPDDTAYAQYEVRGIVKGEHAHGDGTEVTMDIGINNIPDAIYDQMLYHHTDGLTSSSDNSAWTEQLWRRYKNPIYYLIAADSIPDGGDDAETTFITISNLAHGGFRGLLSGRTGDTSANGGHPDATLQSIQMSTTDLFTCDLAVYGIDFRGDL